MAYIPLLLFKIYCFYSLIADLSINSDNPLQATDDENDTIEYYIPNGGLGSLSFDIVTVNESNLGYFGYLYFKSGVVLDREVCFPY